VLVPLLALAPLAAMAAAGEGGKPSETIFIAQILVLVLFGRAMGEALQRVGQPAVMGQLIAGIILGPSVLGALAPEWQHALFPANPAQKSMIDALAQFGILLLLLLAGMETDLGLVGKVKRAAASVSLTGIAIPFACGFALGEMLPDSILPNPDQRLVTSLFLGTALSISSVKIVAMVVREMDFVRRNVGQVIIASAIIDDTVGWIIIAITFSIASTGAFELHSVLTSVALTAVFLGLSFTVGRRIVFHLVRWTNDSFMGDAPVVSMVLVIMGSMALVTHWIGVHSVLGAFVAGMLVGELPILTRRIEEQLRGLVTALFMPVFFGLSGLSADLTVLADPRLALLTAGLVLIASVGKFAGAFAGGLMGGLDRRECLALACGMNARGSTEVVVASIGLSMGALTQDLFTMIVAMAVLTTMAMPPTLRWALARLPIKREESERLEREAFESKGFVTRLERLLLATGDSVDGRFAARLAGLVAGMRGLPVTTLKMAPSVPERAPEPAMAGPDEALREAASQAVETTTPARTEIDVVARDAAGAPADAIAEEARKGYDILFMGVGPSQSGNGGFSREVARIADAFEGPVVLAMARGAHREDPANGPHQILVPINGSPASRRGAEVAMAIARTTGARITALYVTDGGSRTGLRRFSIMRRTEAAVLRDVIRTAEQYGVTLRTLVRVNAAPAEAILRQARLRGHDLIVLGVNRRPGDTLAFGRVAQALASESDRSLLLVAGEA
jgi:Kef-type K+ transport system membrane component KefB/nucleotide-binding universal stress UspA family protein